MLASAGGAKVLLMQIHTSTRLQHSSTIVMMLNSVGLNNLPCRTNKFNSAKMFATVCTGARNRGAK